MPKKKLSNKSIIIDLSEEQRIYRVDDLNWVLQIKRPMYDKRGRGAQPTGEYKWANYSFHSTPGDAVYTAIHIAEDEEVVGDLKRFRDWYAMKSNEMVAMVNKSVEIGLERISHE